MYGKLGKGEDGGIELGGRCEGGKISGKRQEDDHTCTITPRSIKIQRTQ